jgi:hypothetical protein
MISFDVAAIPGYCGMSSQGASEEYVKSEAYDHAQLLLGNDDNRRHCEVTIYQSCWACHGAGKYPVGKRATHYLFQKFKPCCVCRGSGLEWLISYTVGRE